MAKNKKKQSKKAMITVPEIEYKFLKSQNELLLKQNRELQSQLNGRSRCHCDILDALSMNEYNLFGGENDRWAELAKMDKETEENLKLDEALFCNLGSYTVKKTDVDEINAVIYNPENSDEEIYVCPSPETTWFNVDEFERLEDEFNYKFPKGLFFLKCWGHENNAMTDCGMEYDYEFSKNYEITKISDKNLFEFLTEYVKSNIEVENANI